MSPERSRAAKALKPLIGRQCVAAEIGLNCSLRLVFEGAANESEDAAPCVQSVSSAWRIVRGQDVVAGQADCEDWECGLEPVLAAFSGQSVKKISVSTKGPADISFIFGDGSLVAHFLELSRDQTSFETFLPGGLLIDVGPGGTIQEANEKLGDLEAAVARHAAEFAARQGSLPSAEKPGLSCARCAFWRRVTGGFNFWDFGICTNRESTLDSQLTHVKAGCSAFGTELPRS